MHRADSRRWESKRALVARLTKMASRRRKLLGAFIDYAERVMKADPRYGTDLTDYERNSLAQVIGDLRDFCNFEHEENGNGNNARPEGRAT